MAFKPLPIRMCVVVPLENGTHQAFCIACHWSASPTKSVPAAEARAKQHTCPRPAD